MNEYKLKSGLLDRLRILRLTSDCVEFENKDLKGKEFTRIDKADILDFKHGMNWLVWYEFTVGRHYNLTIKAKDKKELRINFKSYFGINNDYEKVTPK